MIKTGFRPSDDAHMYPFHIPANAYAVVNLKAIATMLNSVGESALATKATTLASQVQAGIQTYGIVTHPKYGKVRRPRSPLVQQLA